MEPCRPCALALQSFVPPPHPPPRAHDHPPSLLRAAFSRPAPQRAPDGLAVAIPNAAAPPHLHAVAYRLPPPSCVSLAVTNAVRGAVVGSVFGGAMALTTAVSSRYPTNAVLSQTAHGALRNAAGFASWTGVYAFTRCSLLRTRRRDDLLNPTLAGAFTGAVLTLVSVRRHWRLYQSQILTNAGASAVIAVVFDSLNRF